MIVAAGGGVGDDREREQERDASFANSTAG